jgi:fatty-acyl-CoA synthase
VKVSQRLDRDGIRLGDRVATIAWNTWRHLEAWYGIMGIGAICHTVNPRLFPDQIAWIVNHAEDRVVMTDITFVPILEKIADKLPSVERYIVLTDGAHMPKTTLKNAVAYEDWIAQADGDFKWKTFDENTAAAMCYTSGTTGDPKGVLYSHRSNVLHALMANTGDSLGANAADTMLPVVPLFHANSWGIAFSAPSMGTKLVLPGAKLDGASVFELLDSEKVTHTAGVPTVWLMLLNHIAANHLKLPHLRMVVCGGSAMPRSMIKSFLDMGVQVRHAWGMTEMSPIGTLASLKPPFSELTGEARLDILQTQDLAMGRQDIRAAKGEWPLGIEGLFPRRCRHPRRGRLFRHRRRRDRRRQRIHADYRSFQGRDQIRRRMDFIDRSGKPRGRTSRGRGGGRDRHLPPQMG